MQVWVFFSVAAKAWLLGRSERKCSCVYFFWFCLISFQVHVAFRNPGAGAWGHVLPHFFSNTVSFLCHLSWCSCFSLIKICGFRFFVSFCCKGLIVGAIVERKQQSFMCLKRSCELRRARSMWFWVVFFWFCLISFQVHAAFTKKSWNPLLLFHFRVSVSLPYLSDQTTFALQLDWTASCLPLLLWFSFVPLPSLVAYRRVDLDASLCCGSSLVFRWNNARISLALGFMFRVEFYWMS